MVLTIVSLTQDTASELLYPLLPILLTGVIGAAPLALGVIEGYAKAAAGLTKLYSGKAVIVLDANLLLWQATQSPDWAMSTSSQQYPGRFFLRQSHRPHRDKDSAAHRETR